MSFKDQVKSTAMGIAGIGIPAGFINYLTHNVAPGAVLVGVVVAGLVGYGFGAWAIARAVDEEGEAAETEVQQ